LRSDTSLKYAREKLSVTLLKGRSSVVRSSSNIGETDVLGAFGGEGVSIAFVPRNRLFLDQRLD
jgi:hypothetical protein